MAIEPQAAQGHRLVIRSIGRAGVKWIDVLAKLRPAPEAELARLLFQAPSELVPAIGEAEGTEVVEVLRKGGLDVALEPADEPFEAGVGEFDVAVFVDDATDLGPVIAEVVEILGTTPQEARRLLFNQPPIIVGQVSTATVDALRTRFEPYAVDVVASRTADARFDVYLAPTSPTLRTRVEERLQGLEGQVIDAAGDDGLVALGLDADQAAEVWRTVGQRTEDLKIVDRAFQRYDVTLESLPNGDEAAACVVALTGMPPGLVPRVATSLPIVLCQDLGPDDMATALRDLAAVGAQAVSELTTFQRFDLELAGEPDSATYGETLRSLGIERGDGAARVVECKLSRPAAQWMGSVLASAGATVEVIAA